MQPSNDGGDVRARIIAAAAGLIASEGHEAATTRAIAGAASVQAPTIYRLFGDKRGLLEAVAERAMSAYVSAKAARAPDADPVAELRRGWDDHVAFGLANPAIFALMSLAGPRPASPAVEAGRTLLRGRVRHVALSGLLRVSEERAVDLIHAVGSGTVLALLGRAEGERGDLADVARETVMAAILDEPRLRPRGRAGLASGLRADLDDVTMLTPGEKLLLDELLRRIAEG